MNAAEIITSPWLGNQTVFLSGPPGAGKTTLGVQRLRYLLDRGVPAEQLLILVPQRVLATPYYHYLQSVDAPAGGAVDVVTVGGLARRTVDLFWPLIAEAAGFGHPDRRPQFLTLETAQYHMDRIAEPFVTGGAFDGITIPRPRLVSQIIDNLNKAAAMGFPATEIASRLQKAWSGESARLRIYDQVESVALAFRRACLADNLLDWSLQIEVFWQHLLVLPQLRRYLLSGYRHLIVDNVEEDIPVTHDLLRLWLPICDSALVIYDTDGGNRVFLGADPDGALSLATLCRERVVKDESHVCQPAVAALGFHLAAPFVADSHPASVLSRQRSAGSVALADPAVALVVPDDPIRFHPQMLDWVADQISRLVFEEEQPPGEIAILAPMVSDALRFSLTERLSRYDLPVRTHRPSRELRDEPAARSLLTLAKLAHPQWRHPPTAVDVAHALAQAIADLDPVRARLLTAIVYRVRDGTPELLPFHSIIAESQLRISYLLGARYEELQRWLQSYAEAQTQIGEGSILDHFLSRVFGEVLSQPGFGFHRDFDAGAVTANLVESARKFRQLLSSCEMSGTAEQADVGLEYVLMAERGVVAAQYIPSWHVHPKDAVLLVPAYTFLMMNQPVSLQFWLDAGSKAWYERIYQPLTHPYVLHRNWPQQELWTDDHEVQVRDEALGRLVLGLARRCRQRVYLAYSELNERGNELQGPLLQAVQRMLHLRSRVSP